jgi:ABC-type glycerol-3-phosphate transport system substrate-binding protein
VNKKLFLALDDLVEVHGDAIDYADYFEGFVNALRFEDKLYGLPEFSQPTSRPFVIINVDMYQAGGVPVPEGPDYDIYEWLEASIKLTKPDTGVFGCSPPNVTNFYDWDAFVDGFDTHIIDEPVGYGKRFYFLDNPKNKEAVDWYLDFVESHATPKRGETVPNVNMFAAQLYASQKDGSYAIPSLTKEIGEKFRWSMYLMKGPVRRGSGIFVNPWCISSGTKIKDVAFDIVGKYLCGKEIGIYSFQSGLGSGLQARRSEWNSEVVANAHQGYQVMRDWMNEEGDKFMPFPHPHNLRFQEVWDTYVNNCQPLAYGEASWDVQAPILQDKVQEVMDEPRT